MRDLTQKIGYLKGLRDSLGADPNEPTNRITNLMIDVLDGLTETVDELINEHQELNDYVASIDDDLADLPAFDAPHHLPKSRAVGISARAAVVDKAEDGLAPLLGAQHRAAVFELCLAGNAVLALDRFARVECNRHA